MTIRDSGLLFWTTLYKCRHLTVFDRQSNHYSSLL